MASPLRILTVLVVAGAILYQGLLKETLFVTLGIGRKLDPLESFGFQCERVEGLGLEACEDMWLHQPSGLLYIASSDSWSRVQWNPSVERLNASGRGLNERMAILDTRASGPVSSRLKWVTLTNFDGINGDGTINLQGFDVHVGEGNPPTLRLLLVNNRPPIGPSGELLDAAKEGANSTIELFETTLGSTEMHHLKTFATPAIETPNNVAFIGADDFVITNDKSGKVGFRRQLDPFIGGGSLTYCNLSTCTLSPLTGFNYPNGLIRSRDSLIYVPSPMTGQIHVLSLSPSPHSHSLEFQRLHVIKTGYPLDNLNVDANGDIYAAAFPTLHRNLPAFDDPTLDAPSTVLRIRRRGGWRLGRGAGGNFEYEVEKVLEDDGTVLPGATVAVHDPGTPERYFLGGIMSPFITICEKV